ncbi:MAG TPA: hypothetical protein VEB20_06170 [Azospirillaceae bacterium]|nr:hypothetical protein [Azospirillaceae bacterium]
MQSQRSHDPVQRQVVALRNLWGTTAGEVAGRYLADARRTGKTERITFWQEVVDGLEPAAGGTAAS